MRDPRKIVLYTLALVNFSHIVDSMIMMPLGDIFMEMYNIGPQQFALLVSSYAIAAFFSSIVGIFILDRFDRKRALIFIYTGFILGTFLCAFSTSYWMLLSVRFITGLFGGMIGALVLSIISDLFPYKERGKAMGILMAAFSVAAALGVPLGIFLADSISWNMPFFFIAALGSIIITLILWKFPSLQSHMVDKSKFPSPKKIISNLVTDSNQLMALFLGFTLVFGHFVIIPFIAPYMTRNVGFLQSEITYIYFVGGIATVFTAPIIGRLTDKLGALKMYKYVLILSFPFVILLTTMGRSGIPYALLISTIFFITGSGRMIPPQTMITASVGPKSRGSFMSIKSALQQLAIALASFIGGSIVVFGPNQELVNYNWVGYLSILILAPSIFIARKLKVAKGN